MKLLTIKEAIAAEMDEPVLAIRGTMIKLYDQMTGEGQFGPWTLQNGVMKDESGQIKVQFSNAPPLESKKYRGKVVELRCTKGVKGGWSGVKRTIDKKDKADMLHVSDKAEVILFNDEHKPEAPESKPKAAGPPEVAANGHGDAAGSPQGASQTQSRGTTAGEQQTARKSTAEVMADGLAEMCQMANAQYAALVTVREYLVPLCKERGITVDAQQEAALVQNMLIQLYYQKGHWKFPGKRFKDKKPALPTQPPPAQPATANRDDLDQSGPEQPF